MPVPFPPLTCGLCPILFIVADIFARGPGRDIGLFRFILSEAYLRFVLDAVSLLRRRLTAFLHSSLQYALPLVRWFSRALVPSTMTVTPHPEHGCGKDFRLVRALASLAQALLHVFWFL